MTQRYFLFAGIILCAFIAAILSHIAFYHANEPAEQNISCNAMLLISPIIQKWIIIFR